MNIAKELRYTDCKNLFILLSRREILQSELAAAIGVSQGNIGDWKSGKKKPNIDNIVRIADYFDVSVDFLLGRTGEENPAEYPKKQLAKSLSEIVAEAENFADEAVKRYGAKDKYAPMCTSMKAGIEHLITILNE